MSVTFSLNSNYKIETTFQTLHPMIAVTVVPPRLHANYVNDYSFMSRKRKTLFKSACKE